MRKVLKTSPPCFHIAKLSYIVDGMAPSMYLQSAAIPEFRQGADVAIAAETGSGKTLAYLLPIIDSLVQRRDDLRTNRPDAPE